MDTNITELEKDLEELNKLLEIATRVNIRRNLENNKITITGLLENERKLLKAQQEKLEKDKAESDEANNKTTSETESTQIKTNVEDKYQYTSVTKYGFESTDKFTK